MFVGVVVENFHKCRESQEQEEKARRAAVHARKIDRKRKRSSRHVTLCSLPSDYSLLGAFRAAACTWSNSKLLEYFLAKSKN